MAQQPYQQYGSPESIGQQTTAEAGAPQPQQQGIGPGGQQYTQQGIGYPQQAQQFEQPQQFGGGQEFGGGQQYGAMQQPGGGQQFGQQQGIAGGQAAGATQQPGGLQQDGQDITLEEGISDEMRVALHDFVQAANVCEWCADRCIDEGPQMAECLRLCRDVADLARLNVGLLTRDSVFGPEVAEVFATAAEACGRECAQHTLKHCQECAEVLPRAARSTRKMLASFEGGQQAGGQIPQQPGGGTGATVAGQF